MPVSACVRNIVCIMLFSMALGGCFRPPYNNFKQDDRAVKTTVASGAIGAGGGALIGAAAGGGAAIGAAAGGVLGTVYGLYKNSKHKLLEDIRTQDMQYIEYGDTMTLIVPTDRYFLTNSPRFNDLCYRGLNNIVRLLRYYNCGPIYVAGFTDNIGSHKHKKKLSQAQAEAMVTFLWAHDVKAKYLHGEGYADAFAIGDNYLVHGAAFNRRIEIQWLRTSQCKAPPMREYLTVMK